MITLLPPKDYTGSSSTAEWNYFATGAGHPIRGRCVPDWVGQAGVPLWVGQAADAPLWVGQSGPISLHTCIHTAFGDPPTTAVFTPVFTPLFTRLYSHIYSQRRMYSHPSSHMACGTRSNSTRRSRASQCRSSSPSFGGRLRCARSVANGRPRLARVRDQVGLPR